MRSPRQILDRLWQEFLNLRLWVFPPRLPSHFLPPSPLPLLPQPSAVAARLSNTSFPDELRGHAREILAHRFPILGLRLETGSTIRWRKDYVNGPETTCAYFRRIPYLDCRRAGDHKIIWELNRHQHLVLLAQLYQFDADPALLTEIWSELESWLDANPFQRGINWVSALEVAFRALSWMWLWHLAGTAMPGPLRSRFLEALMRHGCHIEVNLSFYFSPNTHLLGEAVALHALGVLFPQFPRAQRWRELGARVVNEQLARQVHNDGSHFEQSTYYHVYAVDMFMFHGILAGWGEEQRARIAQMADYLAAVQGPSRVLPLVGDDDGGRFFYPFGTRSHFGRATLAGCAAWLGRSGWMYERDDLFPQASWWLGCSEGSSAGTFRSRLFPDAGMAVMSASDRHVLVDAGPFGPWGAGHSHSDSLSVVARCGSHEILVDPGTYTYVADPVERDWFRGSAAHNTIRIDGLDQATPVHPFRWADRPAVSIRTWTTSEKEDSLVAECFARGINHCRRVKFVKPDLLFVVDEITGPPGEHIVEQFWHLGSARDRERITLSGSAELIDSWRSPGFGAKCPASALVVRQKSAFPLVLSAAVQLGNERSSIELRSAPEGVVFRLRGERELEFTLRVSD